MLKQQIHEWMHNEITQEVLDVFKRRREEAKEILASNAGEYPLHDRRLVGLIQAYTEIINLDTDEEFDE